MKRLLVIQTYRHGDVLQTTPALRALRARHPDAHITALVRRPFGEALRGHPDVDELIEWDLSSFSVPNGIGDTTREEELAELRHLVEPLRDSGIESVYNFSNDFLGALLAGFIAPERTVGLVFDRDRRYRVRNDWLRCLFLNMELRGLNSFNLADMFLHACGDAERRAPSLRVTEDDRNAADRLLGPAALNGARLIGLQPGASKEYKRWPTARFVELGLRLQRQGHDLVLFGSPSERSMVESLAQRIAAAGRPPLNLAGRTTLAQLAAALSRCRLLVSNDTATVHVAAAAGTPCVVLAWGPTTGWETAPYREGNLIIEPRMSCFPCKWSGYCDDLPCRDRLTVESVLGGVELALGLETSGAERPSGDVTLYRTGWLPDGLFGCRPLNRPPLTSSALFRLLLRKDQIERLSGDALPNHITDILIEDYDPCSMPDLLLGLRRIRAELGGLRQLGEVGLRATDALVKHAAAPGSGRALERLTDSVGRLQERILGLEAHEPVRLLTLRFNHGLRDMSFHGLRDGALAHRWNYGRLAEDCGRLEQSLADFMNRFTARCGSPPPDEPPPERLEPQTERICHVGG